MHRHVRTHGRSTQIVFLALVFVGVPLGSHAGPNRAETVMTTDLFISGQNGYHTYRIPAIIATPRGTVLAFCEGRKNSLSDTGDIDLVMRRSTDGGDTWSEMMVVWDDGPNTCGNPCPVVDRDTGTIHLFLTHNLGIDHESKIIARQSRGTRTVWVMESHDDGLTWSTPREVTSAVKRPEWTWYATGPGVGIQLQRGERAGRLIIPCDFVTSPPQPVMGSHVIYSDDHGHSWHLGGIVSSGVNECQVAELTDGSLLLNMRRLGNAAARTRATAVSHDGGETWTSFRYDPVLVSPGCQASLIRVPLANGQGLLFFSNPAHESQRIRLTVRASDDEGSTWKFNKLIHAGPAAYSCLVQLPDGSIGCLFERGDRHAYEKITLSRFALDWLTDGAYR